MTTRPCPRCHEPFDDKRCGFSRAVEERDIEICGPCCSDEAMREANGQGHPKMAEWPVVRLYREDGDF